MKTNQPKPKWTVAEEAKRHAAAVARYTASRGEFHCLACNLLQPVGHVCAKEST